MTQGERWTKLIKCSPSRKFLELTKAAIMAEKYCYGLARRLHVFVFGSMMILAVVLIA